MNEHLKNLTRKQMETLVAELQKELRSCIICGREGATAFTVSHKGFRASMLFCKPCCEKYRLPESRAEGSS